MTIAVGGHEVKNTTASGTTCVGAGFNTAASGSTFLCFVGWYDATHTDPTNVRDNKNGTTNYTQIDTTVVDSGDANFQTAAYYLQNAAGGTGTVITVTFPDAKDVITFWALEITGGLTSGILDQHPAALNDTSSPYTSNTTGTTAQANELLVACAMTFTSSGTEALTWGNSFTALDAQSNASFFTGGTATRVVSSTGTYQSSVTSSGAGTSGAISYLLSFKDLVAGGATPSDPIESSGVRNLKRNGMYRMSDRSQHEAQQFLRAQKRAYGFAAAA